MTLYITFQLWRLKLYSELFETVASLGLVSPGAATDDVTLFFFSLKWLPFTAIALWTRALCLPPSRLATLSTYRRYANNYIYVWKVTTFCSCRLLQSSHVVYPVFFSKFSHKKKQFCSGVTPGWFHPGRSAPTLRAPYWWRHWTLKMNYFQLPLQLELTKRAPLRRRETAAIDTRLSAWKLGLTDTQTHTHRDRQREREADTRS